VFLFPIYVRESLKLSFFFSSDPFFLHAHPRYFLLSPSLRFFSFLRTFPIASSQIIFFSGDLVRFSGQKDRQSFKCDFLFLAGLRFFSEFFRLFFPFFRFSPSNPRQPFFFFICLPRFFLPSNFLCFSSLLFLFSPFSFFSFISTFFPFFCGPNGNSPGAFPPV